MKRLFSLCVVICMICTSFVAVSAAGGSGTETDPILISTAEELQAEAIKANNGEYSKGKYYKLTADIDFKDFDYGEAGGFVPFGVNSSPFQGVFDGNGHTVSNLKLSGEVNNESFVGFFGQIQDATVKNFGLIDTKISVSTKITFGILAGRVKNAVLFENCFVRGFSYEKEMVDCTFGIFAAQIFWGKMTCRNCYIINNADSANWGKPGYRGEFFAQPMKDTNSSFTAVNCYTTGGEFAPDASVVSGFTLNVENCYRNSEGVYKWYNNVNSGKYLATAVTADELKGKKAALGSAFITGSVENGGYPILAWQTSEEPIKPSGPIGTEDDPYLISTPQELQDAAIQSTSSADFSKGKYYKLTADLDFADFDYGDKAGFVPFGAGSTNIAFMGTFDGDGHTISNLKLSTETDPTSSLAGMFGDLVDGTVKNVGLINTKIDIRTKDKFFGIFAGRIKGNTKFENCFVRGWEYLNTADGSFGGFVGRIFWGQLTCKNCYVMNNADAANWGVPGYRGDFYANPTKDTNSSFTAINCYTTGGEFAPDASGVSGFTQNIINCYKNSDGVYKWYNNVNSGKYVATAVSADTIKRASDRFMGIYVDDTENVNSGFPRLRWETERGAYTGASEETPYLIRGYNEFVEFRSYINSGCGANEYFRLTDDIDIGANVTSENKLLEVFVGQYASAPFKGYFDGDGHIFKNFNFELWSAFTGSFGVFGNIDGNAVIKNTGIENVKFRLKQQCYQDNGGLVGSVNGNATVDSCYARNVTYENLNTEFGENLSLGGLIGAVNSAGAAVKNCYAVNCDVAANVDRDAELIGYVKEQAVITNCYSDKRLMKVNTNVDRSAYTSCYATEQSAKNREDGKDWWGDNAAYFMPNTTKEELKTLTSALGSAFVQGRRINNGYPQLSWEKFVVAFDGNGTETEPYLITDKADLAELAAMTDTAGKFFKLTSDIDMTGTEWTARIGTEEAPFKGNFDGANHVIENLHIVGKTGDTVIGLFGCLGNGAVVKNVGILSPSVTTANCKNGILAGKACGNVSIEGCFIRRVTASADNHCLGLFVGYLSDAALSFKDCYVVSGIDYATKKAHGRYGDFIGSVDNESGVCKLVAENCYSSQFYFCLDFGKAENVSFTSELKNVYINSDGDKHSWHDDIGANGENNWLGERRTTDELKASAEKLGLAYTNGSDENDGYPQFAWELGTDGIASAKLDNGQVVVKLQKGSTQSATLYTAVYNDEGVLMQLIMQNISESGEYRINTDAALGEVIKVFLINTESGFKPISPEVSVQ